MQSRHGFRHSPMEPAGTSRQPQPTNTLAFSEDSKRTAVSGAQLVTAIFAYYEPALGAMSPREAPSENLG